ncbi:ImmA/IrrE family metallo-endopeptidase [Chloroflexota bacterium]
MLVDLECAKNLVVEQARQLINQLIEKRGCETPPFLPEEFAPLMGIKRIVRTNLGDTSAVLLKLCDGDIIKVNAHHPPSRQNFSCAHEVGHILLSELNIEPDISDIEFRTFNPQRERTARARARERLCDIAAGELLMPEMVFNKYLTNHGVGISTVELLANIFRVSFQSAAIRIAEVSTKPCIALKWQRQRGKSKALQLAWPRSKNHYEPVHTPVRYPSALHKAYESDISVRCRRDFRHGKETKRLLMESKGFGRGENRYVISLAFLDN